MAWKPDNSFIPQDGDYHDLIVYKKSECICDITYYFCKHFIVDKKDRTYDQMIQAARSGKQNIVEGSAASATSKETEIKLLNVAKASHQELLEDYRDYIRHHGETPWSKGTVNYDKVRSLCSKNDNSDFYNSLVTRHSAITIANVAITLICQVDVMLRNLIEYHKKEFLKNGGIREEMTRGRRAYRQQHLESTDKNTALWEREQKLQKREQLLKNQEEQLRRREADIVAREQRLQINEHQL